MKDFENPEILVKTFDAVDIITASTETGDVTPWA